MSKNKVIIKAPENLEAIKLRIKKDGPSKIHILSDFDRTLTYGSIDGVKTPSIVSMLRDGNHLTDDYAEKANALFEKYHPIEVDPNIPLEEKKSSMHKWWTTHNELFIKSGLSRSDLQDIVDHGHVRFRQGVDEFLDLIYQKGIPLVILSASGCGDAVKLFFKKTGKDHPNINYIVNQFNWDSSGKAISHKERIIHVMNKDETILREWPEVYQIVEKKRNVVLLGDSLGDPDMIEGFDYDNLIKIGFLNFDYDQQRDLYQDQFDVVLEGDGDFSYVLELIKELSE